MLKPGEKYYTLQAWAIIIGTPALTALGVYFLLKSLFVAVGIFVSFILFMLICLAISRFITPPIEKEIYSHLTDEERIQYLALSHEYGRKSGGNFRKSPLGILLFLLPALIAVIFFSPFSSKFMALFFALLMLSSIILGAIQTATIPMKNERRKLREFLYTSQYAKSHHIEPPQ